MPVVSAQPSLSVTMPFMVGNKTWSQGRSLCCGHVVGSPALPRAVLKCAPNATFESAPRDSPADLIPL